MSQEFWKCLEKRRFRITYCTKCDRKVWPPANYCPMCLSRTKLSKVDKRGIVLEYAESLAEGESKIFGIIDMSGMRLFGEIDRSENIKEIPMLAGAKVRMIACGISASRPYYRFKLIDRKIKRR